MLVNVWDQMYLYGKKCIIEVYSQKVHSVTPYFFFLTPYFFKKEKDSFCHRHIQKGKLLGLYSLLLIYFSFVCAERSFIFVNVYDKTKHEILLNNYLQINYGIPKPSLGKCQEGYVAQRIEYLLQFIATGLKFDLKSYMFIVSIVCCKDPKLAPIISPPAIHFFM